jgi:hypothetical protein
MSPPNSKRVACHNLATQLRETVRVEEADMPLLILAILFGLLLPEPLHAQDVPSPLTRIAFGSCADEEKPQPIWDAVLAYQPQLFLFAGDNVYGDVRQGHGVPDEELGPAQDLCLFERLGRTDWALIRRDLKPYPQC